MKRVVIVRHAKSVHYGYEDDFNRDLSSRGEKDAKRVSSELARKGIIPDLIVSSPAKRAIRTARLYAKKLNFDTKEILEIEDIYDGQTTSEFIDMIKKFPANVTTCFIFGHNPGFHYFVSNLLQYFGGDMPTCSTVGIDFETDSWNEIAARTGKLAFQFVPKMLK